MPPSPESAIREALDEQLAESLEAPIPPRTERKVPGTLQVAGKITAVVGMRRAGKTTLVHQLRRQRIASGVPQTRLPFVNFEDERLAGMNGDQLGLLLDRYGRAQPEAMASGGILWSFDEIQNVPG